MSNELLQCLDSITIPEELIFEILSFLDKTSLVRVFNVFPNRYILPLLFRKVVISDSITGDRYYMRFNDGTFMKFGIAGTLPFTFFGLDDINLLGLWQIREHMRHLYLKLYRMVSPEIMITLKDLISLLPNMKEFRSTVDVDNTISRLEVLALQRFNGKLKFITKYLRHISLIALFSALNTPKFVFSETEYPSLRSLSIDGCVLEVKTTSKSLKKLSIEGDGLCFSKGISDLNLELLEFLYGSETSDLDTIFDKTMPLMRELSLENVPQSFLRLEKLPNLENLTVQAHNVTDIDGSGAEKLQRVTLINARLSEVPFFASSYLEHLDIADCGLETIGRGFDSCCSCDKLVSLNLIHNRLTELSLPLLNNLRELNISYNSIREINGKLELPNLTTLKAIENPLEDLSDFENCLNLEVIHMSKCSLKDILSVACMKKLKVFLVSKNQITSLAPVEGLANLKGLDASENLVSGSFNLTNLNNLVSLNLKQNKLERIEGTDRLEFLSTVILEDNCLTNVTSFVCEAVEVLEVSKNKLSLLEPFSNLNQLEYILAGDNNIQEIEGLDKFSALFRLCLRSNRITQIKGLQGLTGLRILDLSYNPIKRLENLKDLKNLGQLILTGTQIEILDGNELSGLGLLEKLDISHGKVRLIRNMNNLPLVSLDLSNNSIRLLDEIDNIPNLKVLNLSNNRISTIGPRFGNFDSLETVYLGGNDIGRYLDKLRIMFGDTLVLDE